MIKVKSSKNPTVFVMNVNAFLQTGSLEVSILLVSSRLSKNTGFSYVMMQSGADNV